MNVQEFEENSYDANGKITQLLVLYLIDEILRFNKTSEKDFEEVLGDVFCNTANTPFSQAVCETIKTLKEGGYINGVVELVYEYDYTYTENTGDFKEYKTDNIDFAMCTFKDLEITLKGKAYMSTNELKTMGSDIVKKAKPFISNIGEKFIQCAFETSLTIGLKKLGII